MELVGWYALVSIHLPVLLPFCLQWLGSVHDLRSKRFLFIVIVAVQLVAGTMTEAASIYFAIMGGGTVSIFSGWFGLYSLVMSTTFAVWRGVRAEDPQLPSYRNSTAGSTGAAATGAAATGAATADRGENEPDHLDLIDMTGTAYWGGLLMFLIALIPVVLFGAGLAMVMWGVSFFSSDGSRSVEAWFLILPGGILACCGIGCTQCTTRYALESWFRVTI